MLPSDEREGRSFPGRLCSGSNRFGVDDDFGGSYFVLFGFENALLDRNEFIMAGNLCVNAKSPRASKLIMDYHLLGICSSIIKCHCSLILLVDKNIINASKALQKRRFVNYYKCH